MSTRSQDQAAARLSRRAALKALAAFGVAAPLFSRALAAAPSDRTLVTLFLRGGVDGLSLAPPVGDADYAGLRPSLRLGPSGGGDDAVVPLNELFALHPAMAALGPLYTSKRLAVLHAVGQAKPSRSHFDAQDFLESGTPGEKRGDGWLSRASLSLPEGTPFRLVALQNALPLAMAGEAQSLAFPSLKAFRVAGGAPAASTFDAMYSDAVDEALRSSGRDAFDSLALVRKNSLSDEPPRHGATYPKGPLGQRLQDIARLVHAGAGVRFAATEASGFDTHLGQGAAKGQLANRLGDLAQALAAFATDLGDQLGKVCLVAFTEFGRTAKENGTHGTDHGTASAALVLGGGVKGGRVVADWPGLAPEKLYEGRDLRVTTDLRDVFAECLEVTCGAAPGAEVFPGLKRRRLGLF
jgi:uncharacterized protein (DUF1501 family)